MSWEHALLKDSLRSPKSKAPIARAVAAWATTFLLLSVFPALSLAAPGGESDNKPDMTAAHGSPTLPTKALSHGSDDNETDDDNETKDGNATRGRSGNHSEGGDRKGGRLAAENGSYEGRFISFSLDPESCLLTNLQVYNFTVMDSIDLAGPCEAEAHGSHLRIEGNGTSLDVHDAPNGLVRFSARDADVTFDWASAWTLNASSSKVEATMGDNLVRLRLDGDDNKTDGNETAGSMSTNGDQTTASGGAGSLWTHPLKGNDPAREAIRDAIDHKRVAAEIDVLLTDGNESSEVLAYEDVVVKVHKADNGSYRFLVDANLTEGRVFVVNLAPGMFQNGRIAVDYFDVDESGVATAVEITQADDLDDVLAQDAGEGPEYWIVHDAGGAHVLVSVPHFSAHMFQLSSAISMATPSLVLGAALGVVFVMAAAGGIFVRRKA